MGRLLGIFKRQGGKCHDCQNDCDKGTAVVKKRSNVKGTPNNRIVVCNKCNKTPKSKISKTGSKRKKLYDRQNGQCYYCDKHCVMDGALNHPDTATIEHLIPKSEGGTRALSNLVMACQECNRLRGISPFNPITGERIVPLKSKKTVLKTIAKKENFKVSPKEDRKYLVLALCISNILLTVALLIMIIKGK